MHDLKLTMSAWPLIGLAVLAVAGCGGGADNENAPLAEGENRAPKGNQPGAPETTLQIASWDETQQLLADHAGKVVVLDVWASW